MTIKVRVQEKNWKGLDKWTGDVIDSSDGLFPKDSVIHYEAEINVGKVSSDGTTGLVGGIHNGADTHTADLQETDDDDVVIVTRRRRNTF